MVYLWMLKRYMKHWNIIHAPRLISPWKSSARNPRICMALTSSIRMESCFNGLETEMWTMAISKVSLIIMCFKRLRLEVEEIIETLAISYLSKVWIKKQNLNISEIKVQFSKAPTVCKKIECSKIEASTTWIFALVMNLASQSNNGIHPCFSLSSRNQRLSTAWVFTGIATWTCHPE